MVRRLFDKDSVRESNLMNYGYIVGLFLGYSVNFLTFAAVEVITPSLIVVDMLYLRCLTHLHLVNAWLTKVATSQRSRTQPLNLGEVRFRGGTASPFPRL